MIEQMRRQPSENKLPMPPKVDELPEIFRNMIADLKKFMGEDCWFDHVFDAIHPVRAGYYVFFEEQCVCPVYKTDMGYFLIVYPGHTDPKNGNVTFWGVNEDEVYT